MGETIKPIETFYNGYKFRSRLEARWAVFFDSMEIKYQYEPEGYVGANGTPYLPDFYLPEEDIYAEVKGSNDALYEDEEKIADAISNPDSPIAKKGVVILGNIPNPDLMSNANFPMFWFIKWNNGIVSDHITFFKLRGHKGLVIIGKKAILNWIYGYRYRQEHSSYPFLPDGISIDNMWTEADLIRCPYKTLQQSYINARQARFEHGEKPNIEGLQ